MTGEACRTLPAPAVSPVSLRRFRSPAEVIVVAVRWYQHYGLSYREVEELLAERGIEASHVTVYRRLHRFTHCRPTPTGSPATRPATGGSSPRPGDLDR